MNIKDIVAQSIKAVMTIDYRPLEVIIVDNGSTDGSFEFIKKLVQEYVPPDVTAKIIRSTKNYGFTGANNIAFRLINKNSKYIALINNDLVPKRDSLKRLVEYMAKNSEVAGVQGKILTWDGYRIDSAGFYLTNLWTVYARGHMEPASTYNEESVVTYVSGAYSLYRVDVLRCFEYLFRPQFFMYGDDYELGIRLWRSGHIQKYTPVKAGRHYRSATFGQIPDRQEYFQWRGIVATMSIYDKFWVLRLLILLPYFIGTCIMRRPGGYLLRGVLDGISLGLRLRNKIRVDTSYKEPRLRLSIIRWYAVSAKLALAYGIVKKGMSYIAATRYYARQLIGSWNG